MEEDTIMITAKAKETNKHKKSIQALKK